MPRKVNVVEDLDGNKIVFIHDVRFKGKRSIEWTDVETYLKEFVGESYVIEDTNDMIYIGADFPDEYAHTEYSTSLKGANAKAKANAAQGVPELIEIATGKEYRKTQKRNTVKMQSLDGIDILPDLPYLYIRRVEKWKDIMCST